MLDLLLNESRNSSRWQFAAPTATKFTSAQIVDVQRASAAWTTGEHPSGAVDGRPENRAAIHFGQQILNPDWKSASTKPLLHRYPPFLFI
jgi:hypothetical protein